jgi:xanthine dehydrogenase accessory factor
LLPKIRYNQDFSPAELQRIHGPAGLDLGAQTPEEIALAMLAEAHKVLKGHRGLSLRDLNS